MKISTYHRMLGDNVRFYKGDMRRLVLDLVTDECIERLINIDPSCDWRILSGSLRNYIKTKSRAAQLFDLPQVNENPNKGLIKKCLLDFSDRYRKRSYESRPWFDRVYVTTLFTFHWDITVKTVEFCKTLVRDESEVKIGGILATLLSKELFDQVGIAPITGLLDRPGILDPDHPVGKNIVIDDLPLDYSILDEIDYVYPTRSAYFTFMTKGCTRTCAFCSVPKLEPEYKPHIETQTKFGYVRQDFGDQQNLLLMDNNVLASPNFFEIIDEIKEMGFVKGATYVEPNQLEIAVQHLKRGTNDRAYVRRAIKLLNGLMPRLQGAKAQEYYNTLAENNLLSIETATKEKLLAAYPALCTTYQKYRNKAKRNRYVDFNQGTDCRYVTDEKMAKLSEIPIRPLRIAFDYLALKDRYIAAVRLAAKHGIVELSNYILYNFKDAPSDLYERLRINSELCLDLRITIYSFPMKYIPLFGDDAKHRNYVGENWTRKQVRAVQAILNVSKGIVPASTRSEKTSFFREAFGETVEEFIELLQMPEPYIVYRHLSQELGYAQAWKTEYRALSSRDRMTVDSIIASNDFSQGTIARNKASKNARHFLRHYTSISRRSFEENDKERKKIQAIYDELILSDQFLHLTLTYDYEEV